MKKIIFIFGVLSLFIKASGQTVLLNVDRSSEQKISEHGPNLKKFSHIFFRAGMLASKDNEGARIVYGNSVNLALGFRKKYKIGAVYSLGFEIEGQYTDYKLKQEKGKILPDTIINNVSERIDYSSLAFGFYNRFNFDPHRGNFLGRFLDLGIKEEWDFSIKNISKNKLNDGTSLKNVLTGLPYVNRFNTSVYARLGFSHLSFYGSYRLTDLFKSSWNYPDVPRLILGFDLAVF